MIEEDWVACTLGEVGEIYAGGTPKTSITEYWGDEIPWISPIDLSKYSEKFISKGKKSITELGLKKSSAKLIPAGSILFSCRAPIGYVVIAKNKLSTNQGFKSIFPSSLVFNEYLYYYLRSAKNLAEKNASGTTFKEISKKSFSELHFPLSPLPIQRAIVAKIEELFSSLDSGIADLTKAQEQLKVYRQAVLKKAFEGELTKKWREQQTNLPSSEELLVQIKEARQRYHEEQLADWRQAVKLWEKNGKDGKKPSKPQKPTNLDVKITVLDEVASSLNVSNDWNIQPLAFISDNKPNCIVDGPFGSSINVAEDYKEAGVPVVRMVNIRPFKYVAKKLKFIVNEKFNQLKRHNIMSKDVLIAKVGATIGDCCIYPDNQPEGMLSTTGSCRVRLDSKIYLPELLQYYIFFQKYKLRNIASQTAQPFLNMKVLKAYPVPFLPVQEQQQLIREIESRLSVCDKVEESILESLEKAQALRQSILKKAFEGKLLSDDEVAKCKEEADYEPASVLLEKIKKQK